MHNHLMARECRAVVIPSKCGAFIKLDVDHLLLKINPKLALKYSDFQYLSLIKKYTLFQ